jgi:hypothetical protein
VANFSFVHRGANGTLSYKSGGGVYSAKVRIKEANYTYAIESTESHSRLDRAFYPHRRSLGSFILHVECNGYKEFRQLQRYLRNYADTLLSGAMSERGNTTIMQASLPSRDFNKFGILTQGIQDKDHVASMVFDVALTFMTLRDGNDSTTSILSTDQVSTFRSPQVNTDASLAFYPVTASAYKDTQLYDDLTDNSKNPLPVAEPPKPPENPPAPLGGNKAI